MKRAVIVHGYKGTPDTNWKPWLKTELEKAGISTAIPEMPNTQHPQVQEWVQMLSDTVGPSDKDDVILIGHSLGCITILKYLEQVPSNLLVNACVFVAGFAKPFDGYKNGHDSFFENELDWAEIRTHCTNFIVLHSTDDPNVPFSESQEFVKHLNARVTLVNGMGHFSSADNVYEAPLLRDIVLLNSSHQSQEVCQIVDENDVVIGYKPRGEMDILTDRYRVCAVWITNSSGDVLIAQRHHTKDKNPGKWGPAVAGTLEMGETYESCAYKELQEELGISDAPISIGPKTKIDDQYRYFGQWFTTTIDREPAQFTLQPNEVEALQWVNPRMLMDDVTAHPDKYITGMENTCKLFINI